MMQLTLELCLDMRLFQLEEHAAAYRLADISRGEVYTWQSTGRSNWLERGAHLVDALALVVLPRGLPTTIAMPDDSER